MCSHFFNSSLRIKLASKRSRTMGEVKACSVSSSNTCKRRTWQERRRRRSRRRSKRSRRSKSRSRSRSRERNRKREGREKRKSNCKQM